MDEDDFKAGLRLIMSIVLAIALILLLWFAAKSAGCDVPGVAGKVKSIQEASTTDAGK